MTDQPAPVNVTRLLAEAASKSGVLWVQVPAASGPATSHAVWFVWHDDEDPRSTGPSAFVVSGPGEQELAWLPEEVRLTFRSKDSGGRLLTVSALAAEVPPGTPEWEAAAALLRAERLNGVGDVVQRWREGCTIHVLRPHGRPSEEPGSYAVGSGAAPVAPARGTTARWRPWHLRGRAGARRNRPR